MKINKKATAGVVVTVGAVAAMVGFTPTWEGMDPVAKRDMIGTGHPITYCYGQTSEFGKVKVGTRFTKRQCDAMLAESAPKYLDPVAKCLTVQLPDKTMASLGDAAYNAGPARVCASPMVKNFNAGKLRAGCDAFSGWIVRSDGQVRKGLIARRDGSAIKGDKRKSERALCLEGLAEGLPVPLPKAKPEPAKSLWHRWFK